MFIWLSVVLFAVYAACFEPHTHARSWQVDTRTPADIMVDVVNDLGLNILKIHNTNNENNIALSPYGVASILTALLEGVKGQAALEIQKCGGFPVNRDVIRVGLRDIHRLLRSYFIPQEGFLSGLSLSTDIVTLKSEYQSILRFYGFDMTSFNTPIYPDLKTTTPINNNTKLDEETTTEITTTESIARTSPTESTLTTTTEITTITTTTPQEETTIKPETTLPTTTLSTTTDEVTTSMLTTTESSKSATQLTTITTITTTTTDELPTETTSPITTTTENKETTTELTTLENTEATSEVTETTPITTETTPITTETTTITTEITTITTEIPEETNNAEIIEDTEVLERTRRRKRSIVDYLIARYYDDHSSDIYIKDPENNKLAFFVNGKYQETHVNFMTYDVVLPFYYVHNLNALALKFPLDSPKYYLLLVLPVDEEGIDRLICDIGNTVTLKQIVSHLRPTYVRAVIPSFMLRGFVILTSSLQKIGIRQIFEPHHTDFSPMTDDKDIYVTNIEQAITVTIKNYMDSTMMNKHRHHYQYGPVEFKATHPFLYFVMDSEIDVTLVAGKIINPINSRIQ